MNSVLWHAVLPAQPGEQTLWALAMDHTQYPSHTLSDRVYTELAKSRQEKTHLASYSGPAIQLFPPCLKDFLSQK